MNAQELTEGPMTLETLEEKEVPPADVTQADLLSYISAANSAISPLDLEIRSQTHQIKGDRFYALVNTTSDPLTQLATTYTADEIAFVKRLLDYMFETNNTRRTEAMCATSIQAISLAKAASAETQRRESGGAGAISHSLTQREAESMLGRLVDEGWLEKSSKGFYSLSPRALIELKGWLCETYNDDEDEPDGDEGPRLRVKMCKACGDIVTIVSHKPSDSAFPMPKLTRISRANDVYVVNARFDYITSAKPPISGYKDHRLVPRVRLRGMDNITWARKLSQPVRSIYKEKEGAVLTAKSQNPCGRLSSTAMPDVMRTKRMGMKRKMKTWRKDELLWHGSRNHETDRRTPS